MIDAITLETRHLTADELQAGLDEIGQSPRDGGVLEMIVRRPRIGQRELLQEAELDVSDGLVGDNWKTRGGGRGPNPGTQVTLMNARVIALVAQDRSRWHLAGDQLYVDLELSAENLPAGTRLAIGTAELEVSEVPHTGCAKFVERFGLDAMKFVNQDQALHLRGINARVVTPGVIRVGDTARKLS